MPSYGPETVTAARAWLADCTWADADDGVIAALTDACVMRGVARHYEGGVPAFMSYAG